VTSGTEETGWVPGIPGMVDAHCHATEIWYEPIELLLFQMDRYGVERAVVSQIRGTHDNRYLLECGRVHRDRVATVVTIDLHREDGCAALRSLVADGARGARILAHERSPEPIRSRSGRRRRSSECR
jgi:L-fuconolactonase